MDKLYITIYNRIKKEIIDGVYKSGSKLPSKRVCAERWGVSVVTVEHAYALLEDEGYISGTQRRGYFVVYNSRDFIDNGINNHNASTLPMKDFNEIFPESVYIKAVRKVLTEYAEEVLSESENTGLSVFRAAISDYLFRCRGIKTAPDRIIIGSDASALYGIIILLLGGEKIFAIEDPSYKKIENTLYRNDIIISKKVEYRTGKLFDETKNKKGKKGVPLKNNMPTNIYGSYTNINPSYAVHIKIIKNEIMTERLVGLPIYLVNKKESMVKDYYKNLFKLKKNDDIIINSKKIPFFTLLKWNNQICYLVGASDKVEVCNALELKFDKSFMIENKYALKKLLDKKYIKDVEDYELKLENIITYLVNKIEKEYVLFKNLVNDLKNIVKYEAYASLSIEEKENIIKQILNLLNCKSDNANFKFLNEKYSSAFGKKNGRMIDHAVIISKSTTGIREKQYEF